MNKISVTLAALLCAGLVPTLAPRAGIAQTAQTVQAAPLNYKQVLDVGKRNYQKQDYAAATANARELLRLAASSDEKGDALVLLAESLYRAKNYGGAIERWQELLDLGAVDAEENGASIYTVFAQFGLARSYSAQGRYDEAIERYEWVDNFFAPEALAQLAARSKDPKAIAEFEAMSKDIDTLRAIFALPLANAFYNARKNDLARAQFARYLASPFAVSIIKVPALARAAQIDREQGNVARARAEFEQLMQLAEESVPKGKESATYLYAKRQIAELNKPAKALNAKAGRGAGVPTNLVLARDAEFDPKIDRAITLLTDTLIVDLMFIDSLGDD